mmetsp:Transcript_7728/g.7927  ORF Transcript_7728/g.7927 Transcript_7728/m.7927 type:complete len:250 (+) Transcript_7728:77-826(+)|eukprot:CAMPEP_0182421812 /NCGR_PEP_ID=MMETSP1167-20130531/7314_1 /TAXON_ID=2988 /ORGANISM="Mallomonas Sp, Strain CCMP3275" /LENGTH=249 /DNA_ID=CAMNT_0024599309 /DNA_START=75 /DNA_END=824 /DNA_ORIENTATION=-
MEPSLDDDELGSFFSEIKNIDETVVDTEQATEVLKKPKLDEMIVAKPQVIAKAPEIIEVPPEVNISERKPSQQSNTDKSNWADTSSAFENAAAYSAGDSRPQLPPPVLPSAPNAFPVPKEHKKYVRTGADTVWIDDTLNEWPENDYRLFVGDLGNEVTSDMLAKEFQGYKSFVKAKIVREGYNLKSKGYGFVSFMDPFDAAKAIREMNGKYIGNRPMKITKSTWKEKDIKEAKKRERKKRKLQQSLGLA